ncbi:bacteriocin-like protein [Pedobacter cryoconitis]|uniref:Bacteriocin-like protein n=1 Tax=Pedobacter cryoconitis TaxID=188932 RepID=A0A7W8YW27_9SPHI|nr:hypothetical protein [Pedobacter cryoconitis]MBB5622887.1 bacteriocin-like protein [Pedobacter cryoconitis]
MKNLELKSLDVQELNTNEMSTIEGGGLIGETITNVRRMGLTEYHAVKEMYDGIAELIKIEKSLL